MNKYQEKVDRTKRRIAYLKSQHQAMERKPSTVEINELRTLEYALGNYERELYYRTQEGKLNE